MMILSYVMFYLRQGNVYPGGIGEGHEAKGSNTFSPPLEIENNLVKTVWTFPSDALNGEFKNRS